jgi:hypothetical protein
MYKLSASYSFLKYRHLLRDKSQILESIAVYK